MILDRVKGPQDLTDLTPRELRMLAAEIREVVVESVNRFGGHLGSNLGVVELTIALHRSFSSPDDALLWDTGHQVYPHKILTGRVDGFATLRQAEGLSGYSSRTESEHDHIENSHASTALAWAHGYAAARKALDDAPPRRVVAIIGDGSMTGGMAFEGLNNLGHTGTDCLVVLNDNGRSYAPTASRLSAGPDASSGPVDLDSPRPAFFETLGMQYFGPYDGHDIEELERAFAEVRDLPGPRLVHVVTEKGRGYRPAERDIIKRLHDTSVMAPTSYTATFAKTLIELGDRDPRVVAITAAMPDSTGLLDFGRAFPDRFFDVGIAEQHAVTMAAGMALNGLRPVVAIYSTFMTRAFDQVLYDVGLHRAPVVFCIDRAGITGDDGASHHGVMDMALLSKVPGLTVLAPSSAAELDAMLRFAVAGERVDGPIAIRWPKTAPPLDDEGPTGTGLHGRRRRDGHDVCILAVGKMVERATAAAELLEHVGVDATVWDVRCVTPLDPEMVDDAARHPLVVTLEDGLVDGGVGQAIRAAIEARALADPDLIRPPVSTLGIPLGFLAHGKPDAILAELGLGAHQVADHVKQLVASHAPLGAGASR
jgi:1-deoxy-D-xylulose-5-phosphate synthase